MNDLSKRLSELIETAVQRGETGGANVLAVLHGKEVAYAEGGFADPVRGIPFSRDSIFRLYSQTKPITAAAVMLLVDEGKLDLAAFVSDFLPGFANPVVHTAQGLQPALRPPMIAELLSMTAGLSYPGEDPDTAVLFTENEALIRQGGGMDTVTFCNRIGQLPLAFEPGTQYRYSTCADVLGAVVEIVSGQPYADFVRTRLLEPLEMKDTAFWVPPEKRERFITCGKRTDNGIIPWTGLHLAVGDYTHEPAFASGGAGLTSTLDDYAHFAQMLLNRGSWGGRRILSGQAVDIMTSPQLSEQIRSTLWWGEAGYSYGHLMHICVEPGRCLSYARRGEYGWDGWLGSYFVNLSDPGLTILLGQNVTDTGTSPLARKCKNLILASL